MSSSELYYPIAEDSRTKGSIVSGLLNVSNSIVVSHDVRMLAFIQAGCLTTRVVGLHPCAWKQFPDSVNL